ncbi:hypothetical protein D3C84_1021640 [compost metagenome]
MLASDSLLSAISSAPCITRMWASSGVPSPADGRWLAAVMQAAAVAHACATLWLHASANGTALKPSPVRLRSVSSWVMPLPGPQ